MRHLLSAVLVIALTAFVPSGPVLAYSYASPQSDPLIKGRQAFLSAVSAGDWDKVQSIYGTFSTDIQQLEAADTSFAGAPKLGAAFTAAVSAKDADAVNGDFTRAYVDQINRRRSGAQAKIGTYTTASTLVVTAQAFFSAMQGDLSAADQKTISAEMQKALDAVGKPGVFGYGAQPADAKALEAAQKSILTVLDTYLPADDPAASDGGGASAQPASSDASAPAAAPAAPGGSSTQQ